MEDKFLKYYKKEKNKIDFYEYVHVNLKLITTKCLSEMRRKLDITPDMSNSDGYVSLMVSLSAAFFNELVMSLAGISQSLNINVNEMIPQYTLKVFLDLYEGKNPLEGRIRKDVKEDLEGFKKYYLENIDALREDKQCLPKD